MKKTVIGVDVLEMTANGLQKIVRMDTADPVEDEESISKLLSEFTEMAFSNDKMLLVTEEYGFVIRDLGKKTIVFKAVYRID